MKILISILCFALAFVCFTVACLATGWLLPLVMALACSGVVYFGIVNLMREPEPEEKVNIVVTATDHQKDDPMLEEGTP